MCVVVGAAACVVVGAEVCVVDTCLCVRFLWWVAGLSVFVVAVVAAAVVVGTLELVFGLDDDPQPAATSVRTAAIAMGKTRVTSPTPYVVGGLPPSRVARRRRC